MKKILVTGATGFLGSYLIKHLLTIEAGQIIGLKRANSPMDLVADVQEQVTWVEGDVLDVFSLREALEEVEEVYHTAAIVSYHPSLRKTMKQVNIEGTANLVNECLLQKKCKLLHVSSIAAIGRISGSEVVNEDNKWTVWAGTTFYGKTKQKAELEVYRGIAEGLNACIINPSVIIGPGYWDRGTARLFPRVHKGQKLYPRGSTGFVDVRDVAALCTSLMSKGDCGQKVIANAINLSFFDFFHLMADKLKVKGPKIQVNNFMAQLAWRGEALRSALFNTTPFLTKETAITAMSTFKFDNSRSKSLLDFNYRNFENTVSWAAEAYLKSLH